MSDYFSILPVAQPVDHHGVRQLARHACVELYRVQWLRCYLAADGSRMLCWYRAPDAEALRLVLRQQGSTDVAVWPAELSGAAGPEPVEAASEGIVVEFEFETRLDIEVMASTTRAVSAALEGQGLTVDRAFAARYGERLACVVHASDESFVSACLQSAGLPPVRMWRCIEVDPEPPRLFRASARVDEARAQPTNSEALAPTGASEVVDAVIVGAGLSGICMLERLLRTGMRARVYESGSDVGGVWYWNRYPGARVDSESFTYGFSFSEELVRDWAWRELFAPQPEIARYLRHVVERFDLRRHMRFNTRVTVASYDESARCWRVRTDTGDRRAPVPRTLRRGRA